MILYYAKNKSSNMRKRDQKQSRKYYNESLQKAIEDKKQHLAELERRAQSGQDTNIGWFKNQQKMEELMKKMKEPLCQICSRCHNPEARCKFPEDD